MMREKRDLYLLGMFLIMTVVRESPDLHEDDTNSPDGDISLISNLLLLLPPDEEAEASHFLLVLP